MCNCSQGKCGCCEKQSHSHHSSCCDTHHSSYHDKGCGCGCSNCCCEESSCESEHDGHMKSHKLLQIADVAWMEVLKEKIKEHIIANDHKIDELAKIVSEANHERWKHKMKEEKCCTEHEECCEKFEHKLCELFSCCDDSCSTNKHK